MNNKNTTIIFNYIWFITSGGTLNDKFGYGP